MDIEIQWTKNSLVALRENELARNWIHSIVVVWQRAVTDIPDIVMSNEYQINKASRLLPQVMAKWDGNKRKKWNTNNASEMGNRDRPLHSHKGYQ